MTRRCSRCNSDGHNLRTCQPGGVKLFGVRLTESVGCIKKCASTSNLASNSQNFPSNSPNSNPGSPSSDPTRYQTRSGYASDDPNHATSSSPSNSRSERKKGTPWTEEEHRRFLVGLEKLGKGDWRGIARNYVLTRTPTQVASHAQKYFIRQSNTSTRKRRSSLFDIAVPEIQIDQQLPVEDGQQLLLPSHPNELPEKSSNQLPSLQLSQHEEGPAPLSSNPIPQGPKEIIPNNNNSQLPPAPKLYPVLIPVLYPFWPALPQTSLVLPKESRNADEVANMSELSIGEGH